MIRHAGLVALRLDGMWRGALIEGPSGAGKSDLALRAVEAGFRLVADDRVTVWASGGALFGRAPDPIAGLIEGRGLGVLIEPSVAFAQVVLAVACAGSGEAIERMPEPRRIDIAGISVCRLQIDPFEGSAPAKLRRALQHLGHRPQQAYQAASSGGGDRVGTGDTH
jgi:serine kinase of HPr protein (carbohydrate metabolism regulator)